MKRSSHLGHIIARVVEGDERFHVPQVMPTSDGESADVYLRWTTIALGP